MTKILVLYHSSYGHIETPAKAVAHGATDGGGEVARGMIAISARRDGRHTILELSDNGPGVPPRARDNLFQAFKGGARKGGSGLGLAISAELIRAHGGEISLVDSASGARFRIDIPDRKAVAAG